MGTGKIVKCADCGTEWMQLDGVGFGGKATKPRPEKQTTCPKCGSKNITDTGNMILWD